MPSASVGNDLEIAYCEIQYTDVELSNFARKERFLAIHIDASDQWDSMHSMTTARGVIGITKVTGHET